MKMPSKLSQLLRAAAGLAVLGSTLAAPVQAQTPLKLVAFWEFNDASTPDQTKDKISGFTGVLEEGAVFTADAGGRTGTAGDRGIDFGSVSGAKAVRVSDMVDALNTAAATDNVTITFWQKWNVAVANSSVFWLVSPASSGTQRGFQGHVPYGNGQVYFDTAGCCSVPTQRLNFTPSGVNWLEWHQITYVKSNTLKQVWIDGVMRGQNTGANPLPTDFTELLMGRDFSNANNQYRGVLDDFAIFEGALPAPLIQAMATGSSADQVIALASDADNDGLPGWWEQLHGLNIADAADAALDLDNDSLTNLQEYQKGTLPRDDDTDDDTLKDGVETGAGVWVSATDTGTNPLNPDTDSDGLTDGVETNSGTFVSASNTGSDPFKRDTDGDLYPDGSEVTLGSSPVSAASIPNLGAGVNLIAHWDFNDATVASETVDKVHSLKGTLEGGAAYSADAGGRTGQAGDRGMNFGTTAGARFVRVSDVVAYLNAAAVGDKVTVSFWQKWNVAVANSSAFWMVSPGSSSNQRGFQAHVPWGNRQMMFDTAGCCTVGTQRFLTTAPPDLNFLQWHHFAYVKDGGRKQIWIDGMLLDEQTEGADPLPTDFSHILIGAEPNTSNNTRAILDDFAIYATALNDSRINALSYGVAPANLESATGDADSDQLPDFWEDLFGLNKNSNSDANLDGDADGLTHLQEYVNRTDPTKADTDGDGAKDGAEVAAGTKPLDPDTDGDGLLDGVENNTGTYVDASRTGSNPMVVDTDGDQYNDAAEVLLGVSPVAADRIPHVAGSVNLLAVWDFNDASDPVVSADRVHGFAGNLAGGAAFSADGTGRSGRAGDRAVSFGNNAGARFVHVPNAQWLNAGGVPDTMTVSFWQKWGANIANSSAYWMVSPTATGAQRGNHAETPWGDSILRFDTGGCCDVVTQRLQANINTFTNLAANAFFTNWHHFVFIKNGPDKQIWIDGRVFLEGQSTGFLPLDFTELFIGAEPTGANNVRGMIDDFAVYASALDASKVALLAQGASPVNFEFPPAQFTITGTTFAAATQTLSITWQSEAGKKYIVQRSENLKDWATVSEVDAAGGSATFSDANVTRPAAFYRIQLP